MRAAIVTAEATTCKRAAAPACARMHAQALCTSQQPLPSSLQQEGSWCLSWLKEGAQRHGSSTASGKPGRIGAPETRWVMAWYSTGPTCALPNHTLSGAAALWHQWRQEGATCPKTWAHSSHSGDPPPPKKSFFFK
jgi:hypothetical protein